MSITPTADHAGAGVTDIAGAITDALRRVSDRFAAAGERRRLVAAMRSARRRRDAFRMIAHYRDSYALGAFGRLA